jgi:hypothetical protein
MKKDPQGSDTGLSEKAESPSPSTVTVLAIRQMKAY